MRISDWSSDVCSSDLEGADEDRLPFRPHRFEQGRGFERAVLEQFGIFGRDDDAQPREERDDVDREGDEEGIAPRSEEHTSELQSLMRISYAVFCLKKTTIYHNIHTTAPTTDTTQSLNTQDTQA